MDLSSAAKAADAEWIGRAPHEELDRDARPGLPGEDPFYLPPAGYHHAEPGTVLRSRDVELAFLGLVPQALHATQLLYRTTDRNGAPEAAVTTVIMPPDARAGCPIVSYQCAIDAISATCFPSYALRRHAKVTGGLAQFELLLITAALAEGWAVSVPDHEGLDGMWGAPYEPGYHVLDGLRAALNSERLPLTDASPIGLWGYSGGGLASGWAAEMSGSYAPSSTSSAPYSVRRSAIWATRSGGSTARCSRDCPHSSSPPSPTSTRASIGSSPSTRPPRAASCCSACTR